MAKKYNYNFIRKDSEGGQVAIRLAAVSAALFLADTAVSFIFAGDAGLVVGAIALFAMLTAGYGFYIGLKSFGEEKVSHRKSAAGTVACGSMAVLWIFLFLIGV